MNLFVIYNFPTKSTANEYLLTSLVYDPSELTGMNIFMLNSITIHCRIILQIAFKVQNLFKKFFIN
jgi:hypothetical protein